jgi:lysophospholipase L1-like esterase
MKGLFLALAVLLTAGIGGLLGARHLYAERLIARVWPAHPPRPGPVQAMAPRDGVILIGDSRLTQWKAARLGGLDVANCGVNGATSAEVLAQVPGWLAWQQPRVAVIEMGINDLKLLGVRPDLRAAVVAAVMGNIEKTAAACREQGVAVIVCPVWPAGPIPLVRRLAWNGEVGRAADEVNGRLREWASDAPGVALFDGFAELLEASPELRRDGYRDALHLRPETYRRLEPGLGELVARLGARAGN